VSRGFRRGHGFDTCCLRVHRGRDRVRPDRFRRFHGEAAQSDDIAIVAVRRVE